MAKPKKVETAVVKNPLTGKKAVIEYNRQSRKAVLREADSPKTSKVEKPPVKKTEKTKKPKAGGKVPFTTSEKPKLKEIEQNVLDYLTSLDHPATSNEVRDQFGFPLRAPARRIFRRLAALGYGENRKIGNRYLFFVKDKKYPPKAEPPKAEPKAEAKAK